MSKIKNGSQREYQRFMSLTPAQRNVEVAKYDQEDLLPGKPLGRRDKAMFRRAAARGKARAKLGRPIVGQGAKIVPVSL